MIVPKSILGKNHEIERNEEDTFNSLRTPSETRRGENETTRTRGEEELADGLGNVIKAML